MVKEPAVAPLDVNRTVRVILAVVAVALLMASLACGKGKSAAPPPLSVVVTEVVQKDVPVTREWVGTLEGSVNAEIRPKVEGFIVKQDYEEGTLVRQGQPLFQIDPRQFKAALDQAKGNLERNKAALNLANITVQRYTPLAKENAVSQQELDDALSNQSQAEANVESAKAQVEAAQLNLNWCTVTSLIPGIAGTTQIQVGSLVNAQSVLTTVSTVDPIRVVYGISEQDYLRYMEARKYLQAPQAALHLILADGSTYPYPGKTIILDRQVDVKTGTISVEGEFPNPESLLRPGQYAKVRLVTYVKRGALLVPQVAVRELQGDDQVAVVGADNTVEIRSVTPAEQVGTMWVIDRGLKPGEKVIVAGLQSVKSGMKVVPVEAPAAKGADPGTAAPKGGPPASEGR